MSVPGLSLAAAYMGQQEALAYLSTVCAFDGATLDELVAHHQQAIEQLGPPFPHAGKPTVQVLEPLDPLDQAHLDRVTRTRHFKPTVGTLPWRFALVEIDPLLCFQ